MYQFQVSIVGSGTEPQQIPGQGCIVQLMFLVAFILPTSEEGSVGEVGFC